MYTKLGDDFASDADFQAEVAKRFYLWNQSKVEIANALGVSRFKIARLLEKARESGVVTIEVHGDGAKYSEQERRLATHLKLTDVVLAPPNDDAEIMRTGLAERAARFLKLIAMPDQLIGVSWGRTLLPVGSFLDSPPATFVQLTGMVGNDPTQSAIEVISRIRGRSDLKTKALIAPLFAASSDTADVLRSEPDVAEVLGLFERLDVALLSVGSWSPRVTQLEALFGPGTRDELDRNGALADLAGLFFDAEGRYVQSELNARRIAIDVKQLQRTPVVIAVAGGDAKTEAIRAVCMTGLITCLVTTSSVAQRLLEMPPIRRVTLEREA